MKNNKKKIFLLLFFDFSIKEIIFNALCIVGLIMKTKLAAKVKVKFFFSQFILLQINFFRVLWMEKKNSHRSKFSIEIDISWMTCDIFFCVFHFCTKLMEVTWLVLIDTEQLDNDWYKILIKSYSLSLAVCLWMHLPQWSFNAKVD